MIKVDGRLLEYYIRTGGEVEITSPLASHVSVVKVKFESSDDIMALLLLNSVCNIDNLHIYYLPYARHDLANSYGLISARIMTSIINLMDIHCICLFDPHSDVIPALVNNYVITYHSWELLTEKQIEDAEVLVAPDQGAYKKLLRIETDKEIAFAVKSRDKTGKPKIEGIFGADVKGKKCLVLDDICDGGRTFIQLAEQLYMMSPYNMSLFTTYGIYSNQDTFDELYKYYNWVSCYCTINYKGNDPRLDVIGDMK